MSDRPVGCTWVTIDRSATGMGYEWRVEVQLADPTPTNLFTRQAIIGDGYAFTMDGARRRAARAIRRHARSVRRRAVHVVEDGPIIDRDGRLWDSVPLVGMSTRTVDELLGDDDDD